MTKYSKFMGSIVGGVLGIAVAKYGLPTDLASPENVATITMGLSGLMTWLFPANKA